MSKYTKYIFAGLGWAIGGPIGGILGYYLGKAFGGNGNPAVDGSPHHGPYRNTGTQADVNAALMVLIAAVMKADGVVKKSELAYVKRFLLQNYGEERGKEMLQLLRDLVERDIPINEVCLQIKVNTDYNTRYHMVDFLFGIGGADGELSPQEINMLRLIAQYLGISQRDYTSVHERHVGYSDADYSSNTRNTRDTSHTSYSKDPYRVLGIDSSATDDEVRKAYRRMAMKYHPDRVSGMSEEMQRNAAEQMKEINEAYEVIKQRRASLK
jgi:DnaJ like chaperone protein